MKTVNHIRLNYQLLRLIIPAILLCSLAGAAYAQVPSPGEKFGPTNTPLDSWSFNDNTNWTSDLGYAPISFTNLSFSHLGNGDSLVVDTNIPAWLQYNVYENDGTTNLTVDSGSVTFWYAPGDWSSTNAGGTGPGEWGRLFEVGAYTPDSSYGLWSIYVDDVGQNIYFSAQTNDLSSTLTTYLSFPISWTTNYFHFVALTYSPTNTALYLDGVLATNGPGVTIYPGPEVLTNGFIIGSDNTGLYQANGLFNTVATYNYPLNSNDVQTIFNWNYTWYEIMPWNTAMFNIQGGSDNTPYDVFANSILDFSSDTNKAWAWMGQGFHGNVYTLTNLPNTACFLILGTPQDTDLDGLTDAYERLVSKTNPYLADTSGDGISDSDEILNGNNPLSYNPGWKLDSDNDGLPDLYETQVGLNPNSAEAAPGLPAYSNNPIQ
jgi:hypothetical protein